MDQVNVSVENSIFSCHQSLNSSCPYPTIIRVCLYMFFLSGLLFTIFGNMLVIITVVHFKQLHTPTNYLIASLAVSDLLMGAIVMPPSMVQTVELCWYFGEVVCQFHSSADVMCSIASILNMSLISIDRYYAINYPLQYTYKITGTVTFLSTSFIWSLSVLLGFGLIFLEQSNRGDGVLTNINGCMGTCAILPNVSSGIIGFLFCLFIPGVIMFCIYMKIYFVAQHQAHSIHSMHMQRKTMKKQASKIERKSTKTLAIIIGIFFCCWMSFFISCVVDPVLGYSLPPVVFDMFLWIGYFNSAFNPVVYALFYGWYRKGFNSILTGKILQSHSAETNLFIDIVGH